MSQLDKVLVVGGGIGGLCAAIALRRKDVQVDLVESKSGGALHGLGLIQHTNQMRKMVRLKSNLQAAYAFDDVGFYNADAKPLARIPGRCFMGRNYPANVVISRLALDNDGLFLSVSESLWGDKYQPRHTGQSVWRYTFKHAPLIDHLAAFQGADGTELPTTTVSTESAWFDNFRTHGPSHLIASFAPGLV